MTVDTGPWETQMSFELLFTRPGREQLRSDSDSSRANSSTSSNWVAYSTTETTNRQKSCWPWGFDRFVTA